MNAEQLKLFFDRPTRTESCSACNGCGSVQHTPALTPDMTHETNGAIIFAVVAGGSVSITECVTEAVDIAERGKQIVSFLFNAIRVVVMPGDVVLDVVTRWWVALHHKTPQQSLADR